MATIVSVSVADPPAGSCIPEEIQDWLQNGISLQQSGLNDSQRIIVSTTAPGPDDRDALWNKISGTGIPLGLFTYANGAWRRYPTVAIGARVFYTGPITGVFDPITRLGNQGSEWDGWQIDFTFANLFPVIASDYNANTAVWQSTISGAELSQGGKREVTLDPLNVPLPGTAEVTTYLHARGNPGVGAFVLWGNQSDTGTLGTQTIIPATPGNPSPTSFQILPPYVAMAQVVYVGIAP